MSSDVKKHRLYSEFVRVEEKLKKHQFVCWIAGGAVRDFLMGRTVNEFDLVSDATTEVLKALFPEALLVGESFGVLKIPLPGNEFFDLTTFREEADYKDGRRPSHVSSSTPTRDSERRDFTVNSLFWNPATDAVVDYQGGLRDLLRKSLSCVGDPRTRFSEDYLRIVRLIRFSAQLGFEIEPQTQAAALQALGNIRSVSGERLWSELKKMESAHRWQFILKQTLFQEFLRNVFGEVFIPEEVSPSTDLLTFIYLLNPERDFSDVLKQRLKVSNKELQLYKSVRFLLREASAMSVGELGFQMENSVSHMQQVDRLVEAGLFSSSLRNQIGTRLSEEKEMLLSSEDLLAVIPARFISQEQKVIRVKQLDKVFRTKGDALDYLKKKYAEKSEKT